MKKEIKAKIEELEYRKFIHDMKDRWNAEDYKIDWQIRKEIEELEKELN